MALSICLQYSDHSRVSSSLSMLQNVPKFPSHLFFSQNLKYGYLFFIHISPHNTKEITGGWRKLCNEHEYVCVKGGED
jgi:hypothetical protein